MMLPIHNLIASRHLIVLQGGRDASCRIVNTLKKHSPGDWVSISENDSGGAVIPPTKAKSLLGSEFTHGIFDATKGFNLDGFLILAGTLKQGSLLVLMLPENVDNQPDADSIRWNESASPIAAPNFMWHLQNTLALHHIPVYKSEQMSQPAVLADYQPSFIERMAVATPLPTIEQQKVLSELIKTPVKTVIITAKRGRGKSALAGFFTHYVDSWICASSKDVTATLRAFCKSSVPVFPPDILIDKLRKGILPPSWIIIDEAAMIPLSILKTIIGFANRILLLSTTEGYEGTAQGFLINLLPELTHVCQLQLHSPIRWSRSDPIEKFVSDLMVEQVKSPLSLQKSDSALLQLHLFSPNELVKHRTKFKQFYGLLKCTHYRITPTDLRRLFDAINICTMVAEQNNQIVGAMVTIKEGELNQQLSEAIWLGKRRPRGNLVAQSLTAHAGDITACRLRSLRINRIAIDERQRRRGVGKKMVMKLIDVAKKRNYDFVSVSFSYKSSVLAFWQCCGFELVHTGSSREASSGCYTVIAIKILTVQAKNLKNRLVKKLNRNWCWLQHKIDMPLQVATYKSALLNTDDLQELTGFAYANRPYEATYATLCRLQRAYNKHDNSVLLSMLDNEPEAIKKYRLAGRKAFMAGLRSEVREILAHKGIHSLMIPNHDE